MAKILCNYFGLSMAAEGKSEFVGRQAAAFLGYVQQDAERCAENCGCAEDLSDAPEKIKREILRNDEELRRREQTAPGVEHDVVAIYDNAGIPSIMHRFRRVTNKELFGGSDAVHPAFIIGGEVYDEIYISVYLLVLLPKRIAAGVLLLLFAYREVAAAANEDGGAGRFVAVIGVVVVGKAAGVAVKQGVQLVVIVGADLGFSCLYQRGGLVHGGAVFFRSAAGAVVAHRINIVRTVGGLFVDFVVLHFVCLLFCVLGNGDGPLYNWPGVALCRWGLPCGLMPGGGAHCAGRAGPVFVVISCP